MATYTKEQLSASTNGRGIKISATSSAGTTVHQTGTANKDEIWLYAYNSAATPQLITVQFGGTTSVDDDIKVTIPSLSGLTLVVPGLTLVPSGSALTVAVYAATTNVVTIQGYVNRIA